MLLKSETLKHGQMRDFSMSNDRDRSVVECSISLPDYTQLLDPPGISKLYGILQEISDRRSAITP